jgi:choline dehydrogenase-like flavoprotein
MLIDLRELLDSREWTADVCIVGAGAAGITLALQLMDAGKDVLLLESGGLKPEADTQSLYAGSVTDTKLHSPPDTYRQRRFGGSTTIWGGRCMPFDDIDFETRSYIPDSGWPIGLNELQPYYVEANRLCEAGEYAYTSEVAFNRELRPMIADFNSEHFSANRLERFSCPTDFGSRYGRLLHQAKQIRVVLHANVTHIQLNHEGTKVTGLAARTLPSQGSKSLNIKARNFVLAAGGIEVARLLLANRDVHANGIGNAHDMVGRYYMCHLAGTIGTITFNRPVSQVWHGYDVSDDGVYCRRRLALKPEVQRAQRIGNFIARLHHPRITLPEHKNPVLSLLYLAKPLIPYEYGKRLYGEEGTPLMTWLRHLRNVMSGPFDAAGFAWHMLRDRRLAERKFPSIIIKPKAPLFSLDFHAEQEPNPLSRITLANDVDALNVHRVNVDWRYTGGDVTTVSKAIQLLASDIAGSDAGKFDYDPASIEFEMTRYGAYGGHHIGTTRMGSDERKSVVDSDCRVHGVSNLYVSSASVFPTSSQANPTLTIVAMACRLANHLRSQS